VALVRRFVMLLRAKAAEVLEDRIEDLEFTYRGVRREVGRVTVEIVKKGVSGKEVVGELTHVVRHSPTGMEWGYLGSGPADLARSLLIDVLGWRAVCSRCEGDGGAAGCPCEDGFAESLPYQDLHREMVSVWSQDHPWELGRRALMTWYEGVSR
jgi:hypothetical protein